MTSEDFATRNAHPQIVAMLTTEAVSRAKCLAFAMGHHARLGSGSRLRRLDPEVLRMMLEQV